MPLPKEYLEYPHRSHGMDHDRYDWEILFRRPKVQWPGGARVALWVVPALEWFPLDQQGKPLKAPGALERPYPDYRYYTSRDYGNRVGFYRIARVLDDLGIKASVPINSELAERHPRLVKDIVRRGWEVVGHGVNMDKLHHGGQDPQEEGALVKQSLETLRRLSGQKVTGWLSPGRSESENTLDLIAEHGAEYVCDWVNDDMPYRMRTKHGAIHAMPHSYEINDHLILMHQHQTETEWLEQVVDQFDWLYREAARENSGRIMAITLHAWVMGFPYRIKPLRTALDHIMKHAGVWSATGAEIVEAYREQVKA